jgi:hypothetical protein
MSTVAPILLAVLYIIIHAVRERWAQQRHAQVTKVQDAIIKEQDIQRERMDQIDNTLRGSPFVTHPSPFNNRR